MERLGSDPVGDGPAWFCPAAAAAAAAAALLSLPESVTRLLGDTASGKCTCRKHVVLQGRKHVTPQVWTHVRKHVTSREWIRVPSHRKK